MYIHSNYDVVAKKQLVGVPEWAPCTTLSELDVSRRVSVSRHVFECLRLATPIPRSRTLKVSENFHVRPCTEPHFAENSSFLITKKI